MINLEWFRTFKVVYEAGTLTAAAQSLFISQPGVSLHLNSLEAYAGYRLFERDKRKCKPTDRATILYNYIIDSMVKLEDVEQQIHRKSRTDKATISIVMCYMTFQQTLEEHISELPFNLIVRFGECTQMLEDLNNGVIDFVLTSQRLQLPNIVYSPFLNQRFVLICGKDMDTVQLNKLTLSSDGVHIRDWLKQQVWFATSADMGYLKNFWLANFDAPLDFKPSYILPDFSSILRCLHSSNGFAVVPDFLCKNSIADGQVKLAWEGSACPENTLYFVKRKKTTYSKEIELLEKLLAKNWFK